MPEAGTLVRIVQRREFQIQDIQKGSRTSEEVVDSFDRLERRRFCCREHPICRWWPNISGWNYMAVFHRLKMLPVVQEGYIQQLNRKATDEVAMLDFQPLDSISRFEYSRGVGGIKSGPQYNPRCHLKVKVVRTFKLWSRRCECYGVLLPERAENASSKKIHHG
ncbi:hypothetical protein BDN70DRAFT_895480 [Pholiota conissans]|uniref:Uncharacterized protein n=1 Tax=Pholiota conissans TaxID=109636 RepID=A0A9P6D0L3_9AGAR|nr:hypothetical protein BDN70DRAFT_895480 [Pholiota conissans]